MLKLFISGLLFFCILCNPNITIAQLSQKQEDRLKKLEMMEKALEEWENKGGKKTIDRKDLETKTPAQPENREKKLPRPDVSEYENGRYQAIRLDNNAVFLLDTKEGHLWVWVIQKDNRGIPSEFLFYQGMLIPGRNMGDLIERTYKKLNQDK
ncbi:hypothetical protein ACFL6W_05180 [Thermodesulfobacteriota bacterium]